MADLQAKVPQHIEDELDHLFAIGGLFVGKQKQDIDIGMRRHIAPAIAADSHHRHALFIGRIVQRIDKIGGEIMNKADNLIHQEAVGKYGVLPGIAFFEPRTDNFTSAFHHRFQLGQKGAALFEVIQIGIIGNRREIGKDLFAVNDFALFLDFIHSGLPFPCAFLTAGSAIPFFAP